MAPTTDLDEVHQVIGEFVVFFQSVEDLYRQIGWILVDPEKANWPPLQFRKDTNRELIDKVTDLYIDLINRHHFPNGPEKAADAEQLRTQFHALRRYRNRIVHSAYHEVVGGGQVLEIQRSNPKLIVDPDTGDIEYDQEVFDPDTVRHEMARHVQAFFKLHAMRMQLIHWQPFSSHERAA